MPTRTQLKQKWNLGSVAKVDEIAIALYGEKSTTYSDAQESEMYQVLQVMRANEMSAVDVVFSFRQQQEVAVGGEDIDNAAYSQTQQGIGGMQADLVEGLLPAATEAAIQAHETFYQLTGVLIGSTVVRQSDRAKAARNNLQAAFLAPWTGGNLANQAKTLLQQRPELLALMTSGDTIHALPPAQPPRAALCSTESPP